MRTLLMITTVAAALFALSAPSQATPAPADQLTAKRGADDGAGDHRRGRGSDDGANHARHGRGADDGANHNRRGRGADDGAGHA